MPVLDGLRAISILLVLACHLLPIGPAAFRFNEAVGAMGMSLFFALSGFLITSHLQRNEPIFDFIIKRMARIVPLAYLFTLIAFTIIVFHPENIIWTDLFVVNYLQQYLYIGLSNHFWSLCVEAQFYLAISLVVVVLARRGLWLVWPACFIVSWLRFSHSAYMSIETHLRVDEILSGACLATLMTRLPSIHRLTQTRILLALAAVLWAISSYHLSGALQVVRPYATASLLYAGILYGRNKPRSVLCSPHLAYIAKISYALYIVHPATAFGWMNEGSSLTRYLLKRPLTFALSFGLAHLATFHFDAPIQATVKKWLHRRRQTVQDNIDRRQASL